MTVGNKIRALRLLQKKTQAQFALEAGFSQQALAKWENGSIPSLQNLRKLEDYLDVELQHLIFDNHQKKTKVIHDFKEQKITETFSQNLSEPAILVGLKFLSDTKSIWFSCPRKKSEDFRSLLSSDFLDKDYNRNWFTIDASNNVLLTINCQKLKEVNFSDDQFEMVEDVPDEEWILNDREINLEPLRPRQIKELHRKMQDFSYSSDFETFEYAEYDPAIDVIKNVNLEQAAKIIFETDLYFSDGTRVTKRLESESIARGLALLDDQNQLHDYKPPKMISLSNYHTADGEYFFNPDHFNLIKAPAVDVMTFRDQIQFRLNDKQGG
mgnify:CR=1 FL=1